VHFLRVTPSKKQQENVNDEPNQYQDTEILYTYIDEHIHKYIHTYIHAYMHTCIHSYIHTCIHAYMHTCIHAYMHTCIHAYMHTCIHAYMHTCIHAYIHIKPVPGMVETNGCNGISFEGRPNTALTTNAGRRGNRGLEVSTSMRSHVSLEIASVRRVIN
jgi:hypothetical protein